MAALLIFSIVWSFVGVNVRLQTLQGCFNAFALEFPPFDSGTKLKFHQDEFAGRVSAKVMQTALAVRDTVMTIAVYAGVCCRLFYYFRLGACSFRYLVLVPFFLWIVAFCDYFTPAYSSFRQNCTTTS